MLRRLLRRLKMRKLSPKALAIQPDEPRGCVKPHRNCQAS